MNVRRGFARIARVTGWTYLAMTLAVVGWAFAATYRTSIPHKTYPVSVPHEGREYSVQVEAYSEAEAASLIRKELSDTSAYWYDGRTIYSEWKYRLDLAEGLRTALIFAAAMGVAFLVGAALFRALRWIVAGFVEGPAQPT